MFVQPAFYPMFADGSKDAPGDGGPYIKVRHGGTSYGATARVESSSFTCNYDDYLVEVDTSHGSVSGYLPPWTDWIQHRRFLIVNTGDTFDVVMGTYDDANIGSVATVTVPPGSAAVFVGGSALWQLESIIAADFTTLESDVATLESDVATLEATVTALTATVSGKADASTSLTATEGVTRTSGTDLSAAAQFKLDINGLTADASPDTAADYVATWDASASQHKKVLLSDLPSGGGGGGGTVSFGAFGSRPSGSDGDVYHSTDIPIMSIKGGGVWQDFFEGRAIGKFNNGAYSWDNQQSSVITDYGFLQFYSEGSSGMHVRYKSAPSTPYTITVMFRPSLHYGEDSLGTNYNGWGIGWRNSSSGKIVVLQLQYNTGNWQISEEKHDNSTTFNSTYTTSTSVADHYNFSGYSPWVCFRMSDDGTTNRKFDYSFDGGQTFTNWSTRSRTDHTTPDQVMFMMQNATNSTKTYGEFYSWVEA